MKNNLKISISGSAGSGKSTITYLLKEFLEQKGFYVNFDGGKDYINSIEMFNYIIGNSIQKRENFVKENVLINLEEININTKDTLVSKDTIRNLKLDSILTTNLIYGEILDIDDNSVYVYCMIGENSFQERKFNKEFFSHIKDLKINDHVSIVTRTNPGLLIVQVFEVKEDISYKFKKKNYFDV